jgi:hypothetical protein
MDQGTVLASAALAAVAAAALLLGWVVLVLLRRGRRADRERDRLLQELGEARSRLETVNARLDSLESQTVQPAQPAQPARPAPEFVITTAGIPDPAEVAAREAPLSSRQFVSVAVGESLVTLVSFGHGVRRALSAENRNRIGFEVRREVRRSRKERRREVKEARRHLRAAQRDEAA